MTRGRRREEGQAVIIVVLAMSVFLLTTLGFAIDISMLYGHLQMAQAAADGAAQAGALSLFRGTNVTASHPFAASSPAPPYTCSTTDATVPCAFVHMNGFGTGTDDTVTVSFPTAVTGVNLATGNAAVSVRISRLVGPTFLALIGASPSTVARVATAALVKVPLANCITALSPGASKALNVSGNGAVTLTGCGIGVSSNNALDALSVSGNGSIQADPVNVVGGFQSRPGSITPNPPIQVPSVPDPFSTVPAPTYSSHCDQTNLSVSTNRPPLSPGTYCGGLTISGPVNLTLNPGTYVLLGGGLQISGNGTTTGNGVTFYNTFDASHPYQPIVLNGTPTINLSAPSAGLLAGMLFFEDRTVTGAFVQTVAGNARDNLVGAFYFPRSEVDFSGTFSGVQTIAIAADKISWTGNATLKEDLTQAGAPQQIRVALVE